MLSNCSRDSCNFVSYNQCLHCKFKTHSLRLFYFRRCGLYLNGDLVGCSLTSVYLPMAVTLTFTSVVKEDVSQHTVVQLSLRKKKEWKCKQPSWKGRVGSSLLCFISFCSASSHHLLLTCWFVIRKLWDDLNTFFLLLTYRHLCSVVLKL